MNPRLVLIFSLILFGALMRLVPHWPNFTPVAAMALFAGATLQRKSVAFIIPLGAMLLSDLILGFHSYMPAVYISFILTVIMGFLLQRRLQAGYIAGAAVASSLVFFLITNFAVWLGSPFYSQDATGLLACYTAGLPFLRNGLAGDLFYTGVFFGSFYLAARWIPAINKA